MPIVHEPRLRADLSLLGTRSEILHPVESPNSGYTRSSNISDLDLCRRFALITAVCAETSFVLPSRVFPNGRLIAPHFLRASRKTLSMIHDRDIEEPNSSSIIIRYYHSNSIHAAGKSRVSWHLLGEAIRVAQDLSLHREDSYHSLDIIEAQLRRNIFWQLYTGDKSSAVLNNRPMNLHEFNLRDEITTLEAPSHAYSLLDHSRPQTTDIYEAEIMTSFHLCQRLWDQASKIILEFQLLEPFLLKAKSSPVINDNQRSALMDVFVKFVSFTDDLPLWFGSLVQPHLCEDAIKRYQQCGFWIQRINLHVTFQTLNLIVLQRFVDLNLLEFLGLSSEPVIIALKKTEIARELLTTIQEAPFEYLQTNGESCVRIIYP